MRIVLFLLTSFMLFALGVYAQPTLQWARTIDYASLMDIARDATIDADGYIYSTGSATIVQNSIVGADFCTVKQDANGDTLWVRYWGDPVGYSDEANSIAVDQSGNVYVGGYSQSSLFNINMVIVKYDPDGNELWNRKVSIGSSINVSVKNISVNADHVYACASAINPTASVVTVQYDLSGNLIWSRQYDGPFFVAYATGLSADNAGSIYVAGYSIFDLAVGTEMMLIKYNSAGDQLWVSHDPFPNNATEEARTISMNEQGDVFIAGRSDSGGVSALAVGKCNAAGDWQWSRRFIPPGAVYAQPHDAVLDGDQLIVAGFVYDNFFHPDFLTVKFDADGMVQWSERFNNALAYREAYGRSCTVDDEGGIYITGEVNDSADGLGFQWDIFTVKYSAGGEQQWVASYLSPQYGADKSFVVALDEQQNPVVAGYANDDFLVMKYDQLLSVETAGADESFVVYPNPATEIIQVVITSGSPQRIKLVITGADGKPMMQQDCILAPGKNFIRLQLPHLAPGAYFVRGLLNGSVLTQKFMVP